MYWKHQGGFALHNVREPDDNYKRTGGGTVGDRQLEPKAGAREDAMEERKKKKVATNLKKKKKRKLGE